MRRLVLVEVLDFWSTRSTSLTRLMRTVSIFATVTSSFFTYGSLDPPDPIKSFWIKKKKKIQISKFEN